MSRKPITHALLLAIFLHAVLLMQKLQLPLPQPGHRVPVRVSLQLQAPVPPPENLPAPEPEPPRLRHPPAPVERPLQPQTAEPVPPAGEDRPASSQLLRSAREAAKQLARSGPGTTVPLFARQQSALPKNWSEPILNLESNDFAKAWLPQRPVVLDQWQNPDGSMQNRVRLPNGDTVCGVQAPPELLEPLVIPIWTYRSC